jgi:nitronate monooxygenase
MDHHHWPDKRVLALFGIEVPILQAPMAGAQLSEMAIAVSEAGGLGALPCAMLTPEQAAAELTAIRKATARPIHVNFFAHSDPDADPSRDAAWRARLAPYYAELGLDAATATAGAKRAPFNSAMCDVVEQFKPQVVSFHFGFPPADLLNRVRATGAKIIGSATTVDEAVFLADRGCDAIIAQGAEAGGHRGMFLTDEVSTQVGTMALVPQIADAVKVPVIAAGGIADGRGIAAAFALGAAAVQIGTAYLFCPEAKVSAVHRRALHNTKIDGTAITNVFSGRPARGIVNRVVREVGPISEAAPAFPMAAATIAPLRAKSEASGSDDFAQMWSGQAARLGRDMPAGELTRALAEEALRRIAALASV